jgi:hypothetical protein
MLRRLIYGAISYLPFDLDSGRGQRVGDPYDGGSPSELDEGPEWLRRQADPPMELPKPEQREIAESPRFQNREVHPLLVWQCPPCGRLEPYIRKSYIQHWFHCDRMRLRLRSDV